MARANPFDFLRALERLGLRLEPLPGATENLAERPRRLMRRLEREGYSVITSRPRADVLRLGVISQEVVHPLEGWHAVDGGVWSCS
ncbi:MAG: hypothetical protein D6832_06025, partial [Alphaproteobacteria bacterium]